MHEPSARQSERTLIELWNVQMYSHELIDIMNWKNLEVFPKSLSYVDCGETPAVKAKFT